MCLGVGWALMNGGWDGWQDELLLTHVRSEPPNFQSIALASERGTAPPPSSPGSPRAASTSGRRDDAPEPASQATASSFCEAEAETTVPGRSKSSARAASIAPAGVAPAGAGSFRKIEAGPPVPGPSKSSARMPAGAGSVCEVGAPEAGPGPGPGPAGLSKSSPRMTSVRSAGGVYPCGRPLSFELPAVLVPIAGSDPDPLVIQPSPRI